MNQKGFANMIVVGLAVIVLGAVGYFVFAGKSSPPDTTSQPETISDAANNTAVTPTSPPDASIKTTPLPTTSPPSAKVTTKVPASPTKLDTSGAPAPPADQALAEITILSEADGKWKIRIDKIRDYIRYPDATNPQLKAGDTVSIGFTGWLDTFQHGDKVCPPGYSKSPKPGQAGSATQPPSTRPQPKITVGEKYLSKLFGCFQEASCQSVGWAGSLYNSSPIIVEYECIRQDATPPPSVGPQGGTPSVEPQQ